ncbi:MAG: transglutaminase TgpA family protein [Burkholderiales bacterium]
MPALKLHHIMWLLASIAMVSAPHVERLPLWVPIAAGALMLLRLYAAWRHQHLLPKWLLLVLALAAVAGIYLSYGRVLGRDTGVALLVLLTALKLMETRSARDATLVFFLGYFLIITNFLYSQTIATGLYMLLVVLVLTAALMELNRVSGNYGFRQSLKLAGHLLLQAIPLMVVLFLLFPRVQGPLWGLPQDAYSGVSGLSDTMSPGSLSQLSLSDDVAFRVRFDAPPPKNDNLYWRGPVFWRFDGRTWSAGSFTPGEPPDWQGSGDPLRYSVTLEPHHKNWLFVLDLAAQAPPQAKISRDFQVLANAPVHNRMRYDMVSYPVYRAGAKEREYELNRALQLPRATNPRARALAQSWRQSYADDAAIVRQALNLFRADKFFYTTQPPLLGADSVDEFLFDTKRGFCEHYASSFAFLMRAAGIPTRIVTGYQGGLLNEVDNYFIVSQADAHAWTEVWLKDKGWVRIDPTAAVSPLRVEAGIAAAVPKTDPLPFLVRADLAWLRQVRFIWDAVANNWNQWVLGYNPQRQKQFLSNFGMNDVSWQNIAIALLMAAGLVMLSTAVMVLWRLRTAPRDPVLKAYQKFCAKLAKHGLLRHPAEGPQDYARRAAQVRPQLAGAIQGISELYIMLRYGARSDPDAVKHLHKLVSGFNP